MTEEEIAAYQRWLDARNELSRFECKMALIQAACFAVFMVAGFAVVVLKALQ